MSRLITFFTVVCLSLASGAPTEEESKMYYKSYNFDGKEVVYTYLHFWNDEVMYVVCEDSVDDKKCTIYVEKPTDEENNTLVSCDLNLKYSDSFYGKVLFTNAGHYKAVFSVRDGDAKIKLISVDVKKCSIHEASIDVWENSFHYPENFLAITRVVPHENNYDVFFRNKDLCQDFLCKATFDYEGKIVHAASSFPVRDLGLSFHQIESNRHGYLVSQSDRNGSSVYLVKDEDKQPTEILFTGYQDGMYLHGLSTEESKFGFCLKIDPKRRIACKQYDVDGETKKIEIETIGIDKHQSFVQHLDMLNLESGFLVLSVGLERLTYRKTIAVAYFDEQGKKGKIVNVVPKCEKDFLLGKLYKNGNGQYCVNSICVPAVDNKDPTKFSRATRCFLKTELF